MKGNSFTLSISILALSIAMTACTNNSDTQNVTLPAPKVSIDNMASDSSINDFKNKPYAQFFTYPYKHGAEIEPAMGGILVMKDGCLLIQNDDRLNVPVFPHGITTWNEETQTLIANGVDIPLNTELFTNGPLNGGKYDPNYDYNFEQQANPKCLENRYIVFLGSQFMDATDLPNN